MYLRAAKSGTRRSPTTRTVGVRRHDGPRVLPGLLRLIAHRGASVQSGKEEPRRPLPRIRTARPVDDQPDGGYTFTTEALGQPSGSPGPPAATSGRSPTARTGVGRPLIDVAPTDREICTRDRLRARFTPRRPGRAPGDGSPYLPTTATLRWDRRGQPSPGWMVWDTDYTLAGRHAAAPVVSSWIFPEPMRRSRYRCRKP